MSVPIATSPGRSGFSPQLSLSYDSGAGNGPFGFGWSLSLPAITRKTDKGLQQYQDAEESDVFILSGAEDLVSGLYIIKKADGQWGPVVPPPPRTVNGKTYRIQRYRPRIEGLFARIKRIRYGNRDLCSTSGTDGLTDLVRSKKTRSATGRTWATAASGPKSPRTMRRGSTPLTASTSASSLWPISTARARRASFT
jgi:hypothetical protein